MKKIILFICVFWLFTNSVYAETKEQEELQGQMIEDLQIGEMQEIMDELLGDDRISVKETIQSMLNGTIPFSGEYFFSFVKRGIVDEFQKNQIVFGQVFLLALASAVLTSFIQIFDREKVGDVCFYIIYLMIFALLLKNFSVISETLQKTMDGIVTFMQALVPSYYIAVTAASGMTSAVMFHQMVLIVIFCVEYLMARILMPAIHIYVLLAFINLLTKEEVLSKIAELLIGGILWAQKSMLAVIVGMQVIQSLIAPAVDSLKRSAIGKTVSVIPGVGNIVNGVTELVVGSAVLIRNCFGATALIVLVILGIVPMIRLGMNALLYKLTGAILQPVCDTRLVGCFSCMGEGCALLLKLLLTTQILFMLTVVIIANVL